MESKITNKHEDKTRRRWLFSTFLVLVFLPSLSLAMDAFLPWNSSEDLGEPIVRLIIGIFQIIFLWHCAYRNQGTKLLSFYVVTLPLLAIISMVTCLLDSSEPCTPTSYEVYITGIAALVELSVLFSWLVLSLKMKDVNKAIQERMSEEKIKARSVQA